MAPHPLQGLSKSESTIARDVILSLHPNKVIDFREIFLQEPPKAELLQFLELEHTESLSEDSSRPHRQAKCQYDIIGEDKIPRFNESVVDVNTKKCSKDEIVDTAHHASLTL